MKKFKKSKLEKFRLYFEEMPSGRTLSDIGRVRRYE